MFGLKIIDRYMAREYIAAFLAILFISSLLMSLNIVFDSFEDITQKKPPLEAVLLYFLYRLPGELIALAPMISMLAVLFSLGVMSKNNEVLAMHACGISYTRLGLPVAILGALISGGVFWSAESLIPRCEWQKRKYEGIIKQKDLTESRADVFKPETGNWIYYTEYYDSLLDVMAYPVIFELDPSGSRPVKKYMGDLAKLMTRGVEEGKDLWRFENVVVWEFGEGLKPGDSAPAAYASLDIPLPAGLDQLLGVRKKGEEMNVRELAETIATLKTFGEDTRRYSTDFHHKIAFPLSSLILIMIGYTISVRAHVRSMVMGFTYGLAAAVLYYVLDSVCQGFGQTGFLEPWTAGWLPNIAFFGVVVYRLHYVNQVRD